LNFKVEGVIVPLLTIYNENGEIDKEVISRHIDFLIARGISGLFPGGTTGEGALLNIDERQELAEIVVSAADGRMPVIIHTGMTTTADTMHLTLHAQSVGADAAAIIPPYFYHHSNEALLHHYQQVAEAVPDFPLYFYDNPAVSCNRLTIEVIRELLERCPNLVGIKDSSGSLETLFITSAYRNGEFNTAIGPDGLILPGIMTGVDACVSGNANVVPELVVALYNAATKGEPAQARHLQRQLNKVREILKDGTDLSRFKGILTQRGLPAGSVRAPLRNVSDAEVEQNWKQLTALGLDLVPV
jgi:4-hydroxy-tetrahydrodipicolinate synthase